MKKNKIIMASVAALMAVSSLITFGSQTHTVNAATNRAVMHTAIAYDKNGNSTGKKYYSYQYVAVESSPVKINGSIYYKISGADEYLKATNIDGVTRKITHNTYIYRSSNGRTYYGNHRWKLYKGETVTTYGGSYKFKNGKHYFRVAGPRKQYIKSANLGPVVRVNTTMAPGSDANTSNTNTTKTSTVVPPMGKEEATITVIRDRVPLCVEVADKDEVQPSGKYAKKGEKFTVDYLEQGTRAGTGSDGDDDWEQAIYHIKGTNYWILNFAVDADKKIPVHNYFKTKKNLIQFTQPTDIYNADGSKIDFNGDRVRKQGGRYRVDKLLYIWVPSENKAELFYHLVGKSVDGTKGQLEFTDGYVKANEVQYDKNSIVQLTPSNTATEAEAAAKK